MSRPPLAIYNPALLKPDVLLEEFTARRPMLETLLGIVRSNVRGQPLQHCLVIGPRGAGKTTTLWAIAHSVARDPAMSADWQPVVFDEESRRVGDLADFWLEAIRQWEYVTQEPRGRADELLARPQAHLEERARDVFLELLAARQRRALLLVDNLNEVMGTIRGQEPLHRLRAFLMHDDRLMLVGTATRIFDDISSIDRPFYDFFRVFELRSLTLDEMEACLLRLAEVRGDSAVRESLAARRGTIRALHLLTGGNPRLVKTFYRLAHEGLESDIRGELEWLLDEFTPYFKAIVDALPAQQQRVFDAVALAWDPVDVSRIATATRLPSNQVSAVLRALVKAGLVAEAVGTRKKKTYLLADRFSNIHYLMRHGRAARQRFDWFVALVALLFPDTEALEVIARTASDAAKRGSDGLADARAVMASALVRSTDEGMRRSLAHAAVRVNWTRDELERLTDWFDTERARTDVPEIDVVLFCRHMPAELRRQLRYRPDEADWWEAIADFLVQKEQWGLAEAGYRKALELEPRRAKAWNELGLILMDRLNRPEAAEEAFRTASALPDRPALALNNLGSLLLERFGRLDEAEARFRQAIALDAGLASAWSNLGAVLHLRRDDRGAEDAFREAARIQPQFADPLFNLGVILMQAKKGDEAEAAYLAALQRDPGDARAWHNLGFVRHLILGRPDEAERAYRESLRLNSREIAPRAALAVLLRERNPVEAKELALTAVLLAPTAEAAAGAFLAICRDDASSWRAALPTLISSLTAHPADNSMLSFVSDGLLQFARLATPAEALKLIDDGPFETIRDAFIAHGDRSHLHKLAPERQAVALELLARLKGPPGQSS